MHKVRLAAQREEGDGGRSNLVLMLAVHERNPLVLGREGVVKHNGAWPRVRHADILEAHYHHGWPFVGPVQVVNLVLEACDCVVVGPANGRAILAAIVPRVGHVPHPNQILVVENNRPLVVLVAHAPYLLVEEESG